uniref:Thiamine transporter 1-like n=1 Tax=Echeneis naucrates TaxID=173247 RepID=A0A665W4N3_ECHNA
ASLPSPIKTAKISNSARVEKLLKMKAVKRWRSDWRYPTTLLCIYGFFSTVKPLEPFLIAFLTGPDKNLTTEQVNNQIFPVWTYSYLSVLVPVFLLTDWLRYKPVVIFQCIALFITTAMLLWTKTVLAMQTMQFFYGVVTASDVAYFSYIYSVIDLKKYRKATSYSRSVQLLGYTVGSVLGQLLVSFSLMSYSNILVFTLVLTAIALLTSCLLPMPQQSMFFHRRHNVQKADAKSDGDEMVDATESEHCEESVGKESCSQVFLHLWRDFIQCYSSRELLYWSVWWALATCGYNQTVNYVQVLWEHVQPSQNISIYNGGVEAVSNLLAALFLITFINNIWVCYTGYVIFKCLYMLLITIAMYQIAADLTMERYALVFGANNFGALALQTVLTSIVVDSRGLGLAIIPQFIIYASYFSGIALLFSLRGLFTIWRYPLAFPNDSSVLTNRVRYKY